MNIRSLITAVTIVALVQATACAVPTTFTLTGTDSLDVTSYYTKGELYDNSTADIQPAGSVDQLSLYDNGYVLISGGSVGDVYAIDTSDVDLASGSVTSLYAGGSSTVNIAGGAVTDYLGGWDTSELELTGGDIDYLDAGHYSQTTFYGYGWSATDGLSIVGDQVVGTGWLAGLWADGTAWSTQIGYNDLRATITLVQSPEILIVPTPSAMLLAAMGVSLVHFLKRRRAL